MARRQVALSAALDLGSLVIALGIASIIVFETPWPWHFRTDPTALVGSLLLGAVVGIYISQRSAGQEVPRPSYGRAFSMFGVAMTISSLTLVFSRSYFSRGYLAWTSASWLALALTHRAIRRRRPWSENLVIVTAEKELIDHLLDAPHANVTQVLDPAGPVPDQPLPLGVTLAVDLRAVLSDEMARFVSSSSLAGYPMRSLVTTYEEHTGRLAIVHLHEGWELTVPLRGRGPYVKTKRIADTLAVLLAAPVALVLGAIIAAAIRVDSRGPVIFKQRRIGLEGRPFTLYKFRTMYSNNEGEREARFAARGDDRLTRVGRLLRRLRVDELPQLWNVLRGDLSLVGPRPEQGPFVDRFSETIPFYTHRHLVRPGLTGWAQVNFGYADGHADTIEKLSYDLYYVKHVGVWLDLEVLGRSIWTILSGFGAR
ncbi:MAG: sugar transferase [Actinobacteria bacterium]|nr:sugar transferase [Actinomycetota bacterium]